MNNTALELHRLFSPSLFYFPLSLLSVFPLWIVQIIWVLKSASPDPKVSARRPIRMLEHNCWMNASAAGVASECQVHSNAECKWEAPKLVDGIVGKMKNGKSSINERASLRSSLWQQWNIWDLFFSVLWTVLSTATLLLPLPLQQYISLPASTSLLCTFPLPVSISGRAEQKRNMLEKEYNKNGYLLAIFQGRLGSALQLMLHMAAHLKSHSLNTLSNELPAKQTANELSHLHR